jgi:hypothetical protein
MNESEKFTHDGSEFEIRTEVIGGRHCVKIFLNDEIVSPTYSVDFETHADYFVQHKESLIQNLKATAKSDIENGMYYNA